MIRPSRVRSAARLVLCVPAIVIACGACSWFSRKAPPKPIPVVRTEAPPPETNDAVQSAAAARAACPNYSKAFEESTYPRDAIIRGLDRGTASVRFQVDATIVTIVTVKSSDPAFGDAAVRIVRRLECRVDQATLFEIPFEWRSGR